VHMDGETKVLKDEPESFFSPAPYYDLDTKVGVVMPNSHIYVNWMSKGHLYLGVVHKVNRDFTYSIHFYDGDVEDGVGPDRMFKWDRSNFTGLVSVKKGSMRKGYELYEEGMQNCVRILEETLGRNHQDLNVRHHHLGRFYEHRSIWEKSCYHFKRALEISVVVNGENHAWTAFDAEVFASALNRSGQTELAKIESVRAAGIRKITNTQHGTY